MATRKIKLTVQYDGFDYHGWQIQNALRTIQGKLSEAVTCLVGEKVTVHGASRTDAGVSALGQVAVFETNSVIPTENFKRAINDRLPHDIVVTSAEDAERRFDVMTAAAKLYRYTICTADMRPVMKTRHCWHLPKKLDVDAMNEAGGLLIGEKDFKSFAGAADKRENSVRTIFRCNVTKENDRVYIDTEGNAFLYNMVRNIVGTLVEVGTGKWKPEKITEILEAKKRTAAGPIAPPQGLCLMWVKY